MKPKTPKNKSKKPSSTAATGAEKTEIIRGDDPSDLHRRYIGVTYRSRRKKYQARMYRGSYEYNLGLFDLAADAALAYDAAYRVAGGKGSVAAPSTTSSNDPKNNADAKGGSNGSEEDSSAMVTVTGAEEIKYSLDWIDCADEMERPSGLSDDDPMHLNFLRPSEFRDARQKEIASRRATNHLNNDNVDDLVVPTESDLKLRIKKEVLNIATTYVAQQATKTSTSLDDDSDQQESSDNNDDDDLDQGVGNNSRVGKIGSRPAKKRKLDMNMSAIDDESCHEEAQTLLSLNKKCSVESKKAARAQKLMEFMTGGDTSMGCNLEQASKLNQASAKEGTDAKSAATESIEQQLQQSLARQQALTIDSFRGSFNQSTLMSSLLSQYSLEQVLRFAVERPDLVNDDTIREFVRAQQTDMSHALVRNNQADLLYAQLQAAMMTGGHFNPTQLPLVAQAPVESKRSQNDISGGNQDGEGAAGTVTQQNNGAVASIPSGAEEKQAAESPFLVKVLEEYKKQGLGDQDQAVLQKKLTNEAKRAALAQKLSIHLSNEPEASNETGRLESDEKEKSRTNQPPLDGDSKEKASKTSPVKKGGNKKGKGKRESNVNTNNKGLDNASDVGVTNAAANDVKPIMQEGMVPLQLINVPGSVPATGLQQAFPSLQQIDPFQRAILQHAMANGGSIPQQELSQTFGGGGGAAALLAAHEASNRRLALEALMSEEYRLRQLRQTLQFQSLLPHLHMGGFGIPGSTNLLNQIASNNALAAAGLQNGLIQQSMNSQQNPEFLLQRALALQQSNQHASLSGALQQPVASSSQGIDAGTLSQLLLLNQQGGSSSRPSSPKKE